MLCVTTQSWRSIDLFIEISLPNNAKYSELDRWLRLKSRCFGDKGDVEDITEG